MRGRIEMPLSVAQVSTLPYCLLDEALSYLESLLLMNPRRYCNEVLIVWHQEKVQKEARRRRCVCKVRRGGHIWE